MSATYPRHSRAVHAYLRALASPRAPRVGPFLAHLDDHDNGRYFNYAIPDDKTDPTPQQIDALISAFVARARTPRLEYLPYLCPHLERALLAAGFTTEARLPLMTCAPTAAYAPPPTAPVEVLLARTDQQLQQVAEAQNEAYGQPPATEHDLARLRAVIARGGLVALALDTATGQGVGGAQCCPPHEGVSELAALGVRPSYRHRGIAAALTAHLTRACGDAGITAPFLTTLNEPEQRLYARVGYRVTGSVLHISR